MDTLARLEQTIKDRRGASPDESYVAKLNSRGLPEVARKVGEEAVETVIAAISYEKEELVGEAADLDGGGGRSGQRGCASGSRR